MLKRICSCITANEEYGINSALIKEKAQYSKHQKEMKESIKHIIKDVESEKEIVTLDMNTYADNYFSDKTFSNRAVCIINGPERFILNCTFPNVRVLFLFDCNSKFLYNNLNTYTFPNLYRLYSNSDPCEYSVMHRHQNNIEYVGHLSPGYYNEYLDLWWDNDIPHVKEMYVQDMKKLYHTYIKSNLEYFQNNT